MMKTGQKVLTVSVAAYNVESSLEKTLNSLLIEDLEFLEVLIIDDGSSDKTAEIAKKYQKQYPNTFRLITKENGGYGSTINTGIKEARGKYFKQLDGDDRYNTSNLQRLCSELLKEERDVVFTPFVVNNIITKKRNIEKADVSNRGKKRINDLSYDDSIFHMHSLTYRTKLLKKNKIAIDEKCFYTDTEYVVLPLMYAETIKIVDYPVYEYAIGHDGQSVSKQGMLKHYRDHTKMADRLIDESRTDVFNGCAGKNLLEKYIALILINDIVVFKLDLFRLSRANYSLIKKRMAEIQNKRPDLFLFMKKESKTISIVSSFGFAGYFFVKIIRVLREHIKNNDNA